MHALAKTGVVGRSCTSEDANDEVPDDREVETECKEAGLWNTGKVSEFQMSDAVSLTQSSHLK